MAVSYNNPAPTKCTSGTYTGDGNATQAITGLEFKPKCVFIYLIGASDGQAFKTNLDGVNTKFEFITGPSFEYAAGYIVSLDNTGFTVGSTGAFDNINFLGVLCRWIAWG